VNPSRPIYSNDRRAPRMKKGKYATAVITRALFNEFKEKHPEHTEVCWTRFQKLWDDLAQTIREQTVHNPLGVKLGSYTGELKYQHLPHKFQAENKKDSAEAGEPVMNLNIVNRGKVGKIKWERRWAVKFNKMLQFFAFTPTREIKKLADKYTEAHPHQIRTSRNTLGGYSVWRQLK
jgi:hypothetical protein